MAAESPGWQLPTETWEGLCAEVAPVTAAERPYERIRVSDHAKQEGLAAYVEEPWPEPPEPPDQDADQIDGLQFSGDWTEEVPKNDIVSLSPHLEEQIWQILNRLRSEGFSLTDTSIPVGFETAVFTPGGSAATFSLERALSADESGLYSQFRDLMVTLGHADDPDRVTHGVHLAPHEDESSENPLDFGIAATAYRLVPDPHTYWSDCDTLEDYIEMCVENGANRSELEGRDRYYHHFHPTSTHRTLEQHEAAAVEEWHDALCARFEPYIEFGEDVLRHDIAEVEFEEDGTGHAEYTITVGDAMFRQE